MTNAVPFLNGLVDAQEMHRKHVITFSAPSAADLAKIAPSDWVKICRANERFWVRVIAGIGKHLIGEIDSELVNPGNSDLERGQRVRFEYRHVYEIMRAPS